MRLPHRETSFLMRFLGLHWIAREQKRRRGNRRDDKGIEGKTRKYTECKGIEKEYKGIEGNTRE